MKLPKSLERFRDKIIDFEDLRWEDNGYWVHLKDGWINAPDEVHSIHEDTIREIISKFSGVERCECAECLGG